MTEQRFVTIRGKRFHWIWLRNHCLCPQCRHSSSFQKVYDLSEAPSTPEPLSIKEVGDELQIIWAGDPPHYSTYPISWLLSLAYDNETSDDDKSETKKSLWNLAELEQYAPIWSDAITDLSENWFHQLRELGFSLVQNLPSQELEAFISSIGPIYHKFRYGPFSKSQAIPNAQDLSQSAEGYALLPHTDSSFLYDSQRMVEYFYCVENQARGGESILVDGFKIAKDLQEENPEVYQILSETPVEFRHLLRNWEYYFRRKTPIIKLDINNDDIFGIYFSHKNFNHPLVSFEKMESFYDAYSTLLRYLKSPKYQYCFKLMPGDLLVFQNFRILHGRNAFVANSGHRELTVTYQSWDYFSGRHNFRNLKNLYSAESMFLKKD